jgi:hypothetical protein
VALAIGHIAFDLFEKKRAPRAAIAVEQTAIPLNEAERAVCATFNIDEKTFVAARARRSAGGNPLSQTPMGIKVPREAGSIATIGPQRGPTGFTERR